MTKKLLAMILAGLILLGVLSSCSGGGNTDTDAVTTENTTEDTTDGVDDEGSEELEIVVAQPKNVKYSILLSSEFTAEQRGHIRSILTELNLEYDIDLEYRIESSSNKEDPEDFEILIGNVKNRSDSINAGKELANGERIVKYNDETKRITILGSTTELTLLAVDYFFETYFNKTEKIIKIPKDLSYSYRPDSSIRSLTLDGVRIENYQIVVSSKDDIYSYYTALNIVDYFAANMFYEIPIVMNGSEKSEYEILIGDTDRSEDDTSLEFDEGEYMLVQKGSKIVLRGYGIYVAAGMGDIVKNYLSGAEKNKDIKITSLPVSERVSTYQAPEKAENVILMIGDGMGFNHVNVALNSSLKEFTAQSFTNKGSAVTRSQSVINGNAAYTDSAAAATALATGYKTINGYIGKDANGNNVQNVRELAHAYGAKTAVVTTDAITGATPGGFLAHNISRNNTTELQSEIDALKAKGRVDYCEGDVGDELTVHTRSALQTIAYTDSPFFIMVEEAYIDKDSHSNLLDSAIGKVVRFNDVITYAGCFVMVNPDTALVVTADHETGGLTANESATYGYKYTTGNHTNADVPVYAIGGGTQIFNNVAIDNTEIAKFAAKHYGATGFGQAA